MAYVVLKFSPIFQNTNELTKNKRIFGLVFICSNFMIKSIPYITYQCKVLLNELVISIPAKCNVTKCKNLTENILGMYIVVYLMWINCILFLFLISVNTSIYQLNSQQRLWGTHIQHNRWKLCYYMIDYIITMFFAIHCDLLTFSKGKMGIHLSF